MCYRLLQLLSYYQIELNINNVQIAFIFHRVPLIFVRTVNFLHGFLCGAMFWIWIWHLSSQVGTALLNMAELLPADGKHRTNFLFWFPFVRSFCFTYETPPILFPVWGHEWVAAPFIWVIDFITSHKERIYAGLLNCDMQSQGSRAVQGMLHSDSPLRLLGIILQLASSMCIYPGATLF